MKKKQPEAQPQREKRIKVLESQLARFHTISVVFQPLDPDGIALAE